MKSNNFFSKLYNSILKPMYRVVLIIASLLFKALLWIPKTISKKLRFSISFKISAAYLRIMFKVFLFIFICMISTIMYFEIGNIVKTTNKIINPILQNEGKNIQGIISNLKENNLQFSIYHNNLEQAYSSNKNIDNFIAKYKIPFFIDGNYFYYISRYNLNNDNESYTIYIYNDIKDLVKDIIKLSILFLPSYALGIFLTIMTGSSINKKVLYPIHEMTHTVKGISAHNLNMRINVTGSQDELKDLARTFNEMMNRIEEAYSKQQEFVSDASHELRTPISVIQGYANMLNRWGKSDPKVLQESIDAIANESENMKDLVEKLLFIARSDKDNLKLQKTEFDVNELLLETIKESQMIDSSHAYEYDIIGTNLIFADRNRIKQVMRILIDNAVKYTPSNGKIIIKSEVEDNFFVISISDTGIGINKDDISHIFDRFYRSDKSRTKEKGGHGLGLHIAKIITLRHKGKIKVKSKIDEGTEFKVYLPLERLD